MKHIDLDAQDKHVKQFVLSLYLEDEESVLEVGGKPVARMLPVSGAAPDQEKLKAAILARRDQSRALNAEWEDADQEVWNQLPNDQQ